MRAQIHSQDLPSIGQQPNRRWVAETLNQFYQQHANRISEVRARLRDSQRQVIDVLPQLLHTNHVGLPGYVSTDSPHGIYAYQPNATQSAALKQFAASRPVSKQPIKPAIDAIYLMGSAGSVGHTLTSDLDIWVCASSEYHPALEEKLVGIAQWAMRKGVELQSFTVDSKQFLGSYSFATSPLLLDEFYRSACLIAGKYPVWWLTPPNSPGKHADAVAHLSNTRLIKQNDYLDFGEIADFSSQEILTAAAAELKRCIDTPYKSLLKLALLESYAQGAPALADTYKQQVSADAKANLDASPATQTIDAYCLLANHIDEHFALQPDRLHFFRRAWLIKTSRGNLHLTQQPNWLATCLKWGYQLADVEQLRRNEKWSLQQLAQENNDVMHAIGQALVFIRRLQQQRQPESTLNLSRALEYYKPYFDDLLLRKVQTANAESGNPRQAAAKINTHILTARLPKLLPTVMPSKFVEKVEIQRNPSSGWILSNRHDLIFACNHLIELIHWLHRHKIAYSCVECDEALRPLIDPIYAAVEAHFQQSSTQTWIVNTELQQPRNEDCDGNILISNDDYPLAYGTHKTCLIDHLDLCLGTDRTYHFGALEQALPYLLSESFENTQLPRIHASGGLRSMIIVNSLKKLISAITGAPPDPVKITSSTVQHSTQRPYQEMPGQDSCHAIGDKIYRFEQIAPQESQHIEGIRLSWRLLVEPPDGPKHSFTGHPTPS